ncbi:hypothetical protein NQZ68_017080 [Dissostichus eleginoides]|nr:hypothetical protein NQZ68_017080 [Dissostichus eleginoides]
MDVMSVLNHRADVAFSTLATRSSEHMSTCQPPDSPHYDPTCFQIPVWRSVKVLMGSAKPIYMPV